MSSGKRRREKPGKQMSEANHNLHTLHGGQQGALLGAPSRNPAAIIDDEQLARMVSAMLVVQAIADNQAQSSPCLVADKDAKSCSLPGRSTAHHDQNSASEPVNGNATECINNKQQTKMVSAMPKPPSGAYKHPRPSSRPAARDPESAPHHLPTASTVDQIQDMIDQMLRDSAAIGLQLERDSTELSHMSTLLEARSGQLDNCKSGIEDIVKPIVQGPARDELETLVQAMDEWTRKNDRDRAANKIQDDLAREMSGKLGELDLALHISLQGHSKSVSSSIELLDEMKSMKVIGTPGSSPASVSGSEGHESCGESAIVQTARVETYTKATGKVKRVVSFKADPCPQPQQATVGAYDGMKTSSDPVEASDKHKARGRSRGGRRARKTKAGGTAKR